MSDRYVGSDKTGVPKAEVPGVGVPKAGVPDPGVLGFVVCWLSSLGALVAQKCSNCMRTFFNCFLTRRRRLAEDSLSPFAAACNVAAQRNSSCLREYRIWRSTPTLRTRRA